MSRVKLFLLILVLGTIGASAQRVSDFIVVDQFGYLPDSRKVAVIRNPEIGFDSEDSFTPGSSYALVNVSTGDTVYRAEAISWNDGATDESSGDQAFHFEFSQITETGTYFVLDEEQKRKSFDFVISPDVFGVVLKQAMRSFFYQRVGFAKEAPFADEGWEDGASHVGDLQDNNCRSWFDKLNPESEKDLSGGWYDAGDFNKYTSWTASYVVELLKAYLERPEAWGDDYNIPESGNGRPDILDEAIWGIDHLLRMQQADGSVLSIVGEAGASPPSAATGPSYYGPPNTIATLSTSAAFALASKVYRQIGLSDYADTLVQRSLLAYDWADANPDSLFYNNNSEYNSSGLGAGQQETNDYGRAMARLAAACYLFEVSGDTEFRDYFDDHYKESQLLMWNFAYPFQAETQDLLLYYTTLENGTASVQDNIRSVYSKAVINSNENLNAYVTDRDPYLAYMKDYGWGSNGIKASQGNMNYNLISYGMADGIEETASAGSEVYIHYLHGVNPLNMVYLSNMYGYGADKGVNEFYHTWFTNGSPLWDRVGVSTYGPAPGFLTGGPNPSYDWDGCCPSGCGSGNNNAKCMAESISPPLGQPNQKSYKDFNTSWPLNSWAVTENSCGYQTRYIRLLSKFVTAGLDCNGEAGGEAFFDSCGVCAGGSTGIDPILDPTVCSTYRVPVNAITITPSQADLSPGDTLSFQVVVEPGDAADPEYYFEISDPDGIIIFDEENMSLIASGTGTALVIAQWANGEISGTMEISVTDPVSAINESVGRGLKVFPNPNHGTLFLESASSKPVELTIMDLNGRVMIRHSYTRKAEIDTSQLGAGTYLLVQSLEDRIERHKLILY